MELEEEIQSHLRMAETDRIHDGEDHEQAKNSARREFGNLDALTAGARTATSWALDPPDGVEDDALPLEAATWGEERVWLNDNCYASRPTPGSVLAEVHRFQEWPRRCGFV